jgi:hypothetical protein
MYIGFYKYVYTLGNLKRRFHSKKYTKNVKSIVRNYTLRLPNFGSCFYLRNTGRRRMLEAKLFWSGLGFNDTRLSPVKH